MPSAQPISHICDAPNFPCLLQKISRMYEYIHCSFYTVVFQTCQPGGEKKKERGGRHASFLRGRQEEQEGFLDLGSKNGFVSIVLLFLNKHGEEMCQLTFPYLKNNPFLKKLQISVLVRPFARHAEKGRKRTFLFLLQLSFLQCPLLPPRNLLLLLLPHSASEFTFRSFALLMFVLGAATVHTTWRGARRDEQVRFFSWTLTQSQCSDSNYSGICIPLPPLRPPGPKRGHYMAIGFAVTSPKKIFQPETSHRRKPEQSHRRK